MNLDKARRTLSRIEDIQQRVRDLEDDGLDDRYGHPRVIDDIKSDLCRLHHWAEEITATRERKALANAEVNIERY